MKGIGEDQRKGKNSGQLDFLPLSLHSYTAGFKEFGVINSLDISFWCVCFLLADIHLLADIQIQFDHLNGI